jgi:hypothetical protein
MIWFERFFCPEKNRKRSHVYVCELPHWRIVGVRVFDGFLREVSNLVPADSTLYIENTTFDPDVTEYLGEHAIQDRVHEIQPGTILPKPKYFHVPITAPVMSGLAKIAERHAEPEIASHMVVYHERRILLEWYDAGSDPIFVSKDIAEASMKAFCAKIGAGYDELL